MSTIPSSQRVKENPFFVFDRRAMVSLGPLSPKKYCTYSCPFCYVHSGFLSYASLSVEEILDWLKARQDSFDIIYVSGDTDSFAKPRMSEGIRLLEALSVLNKDVLFTTRAILDEDCLHRLKALNTVLTDGGHMLIGCVSIAQFTKPQLEPHPIAPPGERIAQLARFRKLGLRTILAARPFLPSVPLSDYDSILDKTGDSADVVLGEAWYVDKTGVLEGKMSKIGEMPDVVLIDHQMDFDDNGQGWKVFEALDTEAYVRSKCNSMGLPFFMRSSPAVKWIRDNPRS